MPSIRINTNAKRYIGSTLSYIEGVASAPNSQELKNEIGFAAASIAQKSLSMFIDQEARMSPESLHHVYEWNQIGKPIGRLWNLSSGYKSGTIVINSEFRQSRTFVPLKPKMSRKSKFVMKASVMEAGRPVVIKAKNADALFFYGKDGEEVFIPASQSVVIRTPGGRHVAGSYSKTIAKWRASGRFLVDFNLSRISKRLEDAQATAGRRMPRVPSYSASAARMAGKNMATRHIRQVARAYQYVDGDAL